MTKEEYQSKIFTELSMQELINVNPQIYFNPEHIKYYNNYQLGKYDWCWDYLMKHRYLLNGNYEMV